jgi:hypothetical protein
MSASDADALVGPVIRWSESTGFDKTFACTFGSGACTHCQLPYSRWMGEPCHAKARRVWVPR